MPSTTSPQYMDLFIFYCCINYHFIELGCSIVITNFISTFLKNEEGSFYEMLHMALTRAMQMNSALVASMIEHFDDSKIVLKIT